tara:strand:- start:9565 stop:10404 length:840 start_codon:yes stop_codon:yes gene_type:complete
MSMNKVKLSQVIRDYIITLDNDDYVSNASDVAIRNIALRGIREIGFDIGKKIKSLKLSVESNNTITLPEDYVDVSKLGIIGDDGIIRALNYNGNLNYSQKYEVDSSGVATNENDDSEAGPLNMYNNLTLDRQDDKTSTSSSDADNFNAFIFENYIFQGGTGRLYGVGGGSSPGEFRINLDQNRIEIASNSNFTQLVMEYVADEARSTDPEVHVYAEEALRCYIYYKLCERKASVPANEKARARSEYYNERRKANARLSTFTKTEALKTIRKNFMQAPKF